MPLRNDEGGGGTGGGFEQVFGIPSPPPPPPSAQPTLVSAPVISSTPLPGAALALDLTGKLNPNIPVAGGEIAYIEMVSPATVSATTEAGATALITDSERQYDGSPVWVRFFSPVVQVAANAAGNFCVFVLYQDGSSIGLLGDEGTTGNMYLESECSLARRLSPATGRHTYAVKAYRTNANCTVSGGAGTGVGVYMPAYLLITRV